MNNLHSSYQKDEKGKEMEKIKYKRGVIEESDEIEREKIKIDASRMGKLGEFQGRFEFEGEKMKLDVRALGEFEWKAIYLPLSLDWVLCEDARGCACLVPLKKENK